MDVTRLSRQAHIDYKDIEMKKWGVYVYGDVNIDEISERNSASGTGA